MRPGGLEWYCRLEREYRMFALPMYSHAVEEIETKSLVLRRQKLSVGIVLKYAYPL